MKITSSFWLERLEKNRILSLPNQWSRYEETGTIENFRIVSQKAGKGRRGFFYTDSDLHKWADAVSRELENGKNSILADLLAAYVELMESAIDDDGYLYTWNQIYFPKVRWKNLRIEHELYCMGHFIEAGVSHFRTTGSHRLLNLVIRTADLIVAEFLSDRRRRFPGHQEIEIALIRLARETGRETYREMADEFLSRRGMQILHTGRMVLEFISHQVRSHQVRRIEKDSSMPVSGFDIGENLGVDEPPLLAFRSAASFLSGGYLQEHQRFEKQIEPRGHSVRWVYGQFADAMLATDSFRTVGRSTEILEKRWIALTEEKTYITGGIGSLPVIEGFGRRFELNSRYSYSETCAAIGSAWWNQELSILTGSPRYSDMVERLLYNGALVGLSLDASSYSYRNPLESVRGMIRHEWYGTACCPSNLSRFWAGLPGMIYSLAGNNLRLDQYISFRGRLNGSVAEIEMESEFPWEGRIRIQIRPKKDLNIQFRIPGWAHSWSLRLDGEKPSTGTVSAAHTYQQEILAAARIEVRVPGGRTSELFLEIPMPVRAVVSRPEVHSNQGKVAFCRGPVVYCLEGSGINLPSPNPASLDFFTDESVLGGSVGLLGDGERLFVPYYASGNRGLLPMTVWLDRN